MTSTRRALVQATLALATAACARAAGSGRAPGLTAPPLKAAADCPVGACLSTGELADPQFVALLLRHFSQITPEWQMKMERVLADDGALRFDAADAIAGFCARQRLALHGTALVWYAEKPLAFQRLSHSPSAFATAYRDYIRAIVGRYRGLARGWDVLNEAVAEDGHGYRGGLWEAALGPDYARMAFEVSREADPQAVLFVNDYNLETMPPKLDAFQRLVERLLRSGAPLSGLGTQTHLSIDLSPGRAGLAIRALARFGLPIHVSELDVSTRQQGWPADSITHVLQRQAAIVSEVAQAFMELPASQRYAFTVWGVRDKDSWLRRPPNQGDGSDRPLLFDDAGAAKPAFFAARAALAARRA